MKLAEDAEEMRTTDKEKGRQKAEGEGEERDKRYDGETIRRQVSKW